MAKERPQAPCSECGAQIQIPHWRDPDAPQDFLCMDCETQTRNHEDLKEGEFLTRARSWKSKDK